MAESTLNFEQSYYDVEQPTGYTGGTNLLKKFKNKVPQEDIKNWLQAQDTYTLHKPIRYKFPRLHYDVSNIDAVWEADLVDLRSLKTYNDNYSYILVVIDVLSKYVWAEPLKDKTSLYVIILKITFIIRKLLLLVK